MLTVTELRKLDHKGLMKELAATRRDWLKSKLALKMSQDKRSNVYQMNKRYVAQILTVANELKNETPAQPKEEVAKEKETKETTTK